VSTDYRAIGHKGMVVALLVAFAVLALFVFLVLPGLVVTTDEVGDAAERERLQNAVRTTGVQLLAGIVLAVGATFTYRTFKLGEQGHITDRISKAVDQLGNRESEDVRIGAVYALGRIAHDSPPDRPAIVRTLIAFVHGHAFVPPPSNPANARGTGVLLDASERLERSRVPRDVECATVVLGGLLEHEKNVEGGPLVVDLSRLDLRDGNFLQVNFRAADLSETLFDGAQVAFAHFEGCQLAGASFRDVSGLPLAYFEDASYSERRTHWPDDFDPRSKGAKPRPDAQDLQERRRELERDALDARRRAEEIDARSAELDEQLRELGIDTSPSPAPPS
jgi:hypothetical protein